MECYYCKRPMHPIIDIGKCYACSSCNFKFKDKVYSEIQIDDVYVVTYYTTSITKIFPKFEEDYDIVYTFRNLILDFKQPKDLLFKEISKLIKMRSLAE